MNKAMVINEINEIMIGEFEIPIESLQPQALIIDQLGLDSLDAVDMLVHLEDRLKIEIDSDQFKEVRTLGNVYDLVFDLARSSNLDS